MNRTIAATIAAFGFLALTTTAFAQSDEAPAPERDAITMHLIDQTFDLKPGGDITLTYRLEGDLATVAELTPPTTTPPTTTPPTTTPVPSAPVDPNAPATPPNSPAPTPPTTSTPPPPASFEARAINWGPLQSTSDLARLLGPAPDRVSPNGIDGVVLDARASTEIDDDGTAVMTLTVPTDSDPSVEDRLNFNDPGLHPLLVELIVDDEVVASHGTVVECKASGRTTPPPIAMSLLASITTPEPTDSASQIGRHLSELDAIASAANDIDAPLTVRLPPVVATAAAIASGGEDLADQLGDDLLLSGPAIPFDVSSATEVGRIDAFAEQLVQGEAQLRTALPRVQVGRDVWLATEPLSGPAAEELRDLGVQYLAMRRSSFAELVAASEASSTPEIDRFVDLTLPNGATMQVLLIDDILGAGLTTAATDEILESQTATEWSIETIARLRLEQFATSTLERQAGRGHLIATPDLTAPDSRLITELERLARTTDAIEFVAAGLLGSSTSTQPTTAEFRLPDRAGPSLAGRVDRIAATQATLAVATAMLPDSDPRADEWTTELDSLISTAFTDDDVADVLSGLEDQAEVVTSSIIPPEPFTFTLTGREDDIDIRIENTLDTPLDVVVRLTSPRLSFPDGDTMVTLAPSDTTVVPIPVEARSNGTSPVTVEIFSPAFETAVTEPVTLTARVTALAGIAQVVTGAFVLILLTWWFSNWRTRRRRDQLTPDALTTE